MAEIGSAFISLVPSAKGFGGLLTGQIGGEVETSGTVLGGRFGARFSAAGAKAASAGKALTLGLTAPLLAIGGLALGAALKVDDAYHTIRAGTGATGKTLEGLQASFRAVAKTTPADMGAVGSAVADLNTRLGLTGPTLEKLSRQVLEAGRLGGAAIDVQKVTGAFSAFQIEGKATTGAMDNLFRVSQATGVGMNDLSDRLSRQGTILNQLGFSFTDSASLIGVLDKAGVDSNAVMSSLQRSLVNLAKSGEKPAAAFKRVTGQIQGFIDTGNDAGALGLAGKVFGTRGAGQFISALKSGKVNLDDITKSAGLTKDTILGVADVTKDFPEQFKELKNQATLALQPLGAQLFPIISTAIKAIIPPLTTMADLFTSLGEGGQKKVLIIGAALAAIGPVLSVVGFAITTSLKLAAAATRLWAAGQWLLNAALSANPIALVVIAIVALVGGLILAYQHSETFRAIVQAAFGAVLTAVHAVVDFFTGPFVGFFTGLPAFFTGVWGSITGGVVAAWGFIRDHLKTIVEAIVVVVLGPLGLLAVAIYENWDRIKAATSAAWNAVKGAIAAAWSAITGTVMGAARAVTGAITAAWAAVTGATSRAWSAVSAAVSAGVSAAVGFVAALPGKFVAALASLGSQLARVASSALGKFHDAEMAGISIALGYIIALPRRVIEGLGNLGSILYHSGVALLQGFVDGIVHMGDVVKNAVSGVLSKARNLFPFSPAKEGPFSGKGWTLYSGQSIAQGLADGISSRTGLVSSAALGLAHAAVPTISLPHVGAVGYDDPTVATRGAAGMDRTDELLAALAKLDETLAGMPRTYQLATRAGVR